MENTSYEMIDRHRSFIPQVDGIVDSRDSLDQTPDRQTHTLVLPAFV